MPGLSPSSLPFLGAGLGYRRAVASLPQLHPGLVGFWEVMPEHLLEGTPESRSKLVAATRGMPVVTHSVTLSPGSAEGPDEAFLRRFARVNQQVGALWSSDHLCFTKAAGRAIGQLTPLPYTEESLDAVAAAVSKAQRHLGVPFLVENISQYFQYPGGMEETAFLEALVERTGCGLLLDVTNLRNNAHNLGIDAVRYLDRFPMERLVQFHLAGAEWVGRHLLDTHGAPIHKEVWRLTERAIAQSDVRALLVERDQTFGPPEQLAREMRTAARLMARASGADEAGSRGTVRRANGPAHGGPAAAAIEPGEGLATATATAKAPGGHAPAGSAPALLPSSGHRRTGSPPGAAGRAGLLAFQAEVARLCMDRQARASWAQDRAAYARRTQLAPAWQRRLAGIEAAGLEFFAQRRRIDRAAYLRSDMPRSVGLLMHRRLLGSYFDAHPYAHEDPHREARRFGRWCAQATRRGDLPELAADLARFDGAVLRLRHRPVPRHSGKGDPTAAEAAAPKATRRPTALQLSGGAVVLWLGHGFLGRLRQTVLRAPRRPTAAVLVRVPDDVRVLRADEADVQALSAAARGAPAGRLLAVLQKAGGGSLAQARHTLLGWQQAGVLVPAGAPPPARPTTLNRKSRHAKANQA